LSRSSKRVRLRLNETDADAEIDEEVAGMCHDAQAKMESTEMHWLRGRDGVQ
jgi:hypothetical protein